MKDITFITTHFFDFRWIELLVQQIFKTTPALLIREILIVDQDRTDASRRRLQRLDPRIKVFQYPRSAAHFEEMGHDHAAVLNVVIHEAQGEYICIFDSDAHPLSPNWLNNCSRLLDRYDAILAQDPRNSSLSHPCFMFLKHEHLQLPLSFDELLLEEHIDTGRLIGVQLRQVGESVYLAPSQHAFEGKWGFIYIDSIYHHGQGSFKGGGRRLTSQLTWQHDYFRERVVKDRCYSLTPTRLCEYFVRKVAARLLSLARL